MYSSGELQKRANSLSRDGKSSNVANFATCASMSNFVVNAEGDREKAQTSTRDFTHGSTC
jgi:hypothetical protein